MHKLIELFFFVAISKACEQQQQEQQIRRRRRINNIDSQVPLKSDLILTQDSTFTKENTDSELATNPNSNSNSKENSQNTIDMSSCSPTKISQKRQKPKASIRKRNRQNLNKNRLNQISQKEAQQEVVADKNEEKNGAGNDSANKSTQVEMPFDINKQKRITKMLQSTINLYNHFSTSVDPNNQNKDKNWGSQLVLSIPTESIENSKLVKSAPNKTPVSSVDKAESRVNEMAARTAAENELANANADNNADVADNNAASSSQNTRFKGRRAFKDLLPTWCWNVRPVLGS